MSMIRSMLRQVAKMRSEVQQLRGSLPTPGMVVVRYSGLSGLLRQAKEDGITDDRGNLLRPCRVSLDDPRPAGGIGMLLWDAKRYHADRAAAVDPMATEPGEEP